MFKTQLMGILNVTPDSCFDQGRYFDPGAAIRRGIQIFEEGADWVDIGGESTRPGAIPVSEEEELRRVIPVIKALKQAIPIPLSIDTMKPKVAEAAIKAGVSLLNDVSGFQDPAMRRLAVDFQQKLCVMHMQGVPQTMQINPTYPGGVIPTLIQWFQQQIDRLLEEGVQAHSIILDPGIGFGKTVDHNVEILHCLHQIKALGFPVLIGLSRKSFLGKMIHKTYPGLLSVSLAANTVAMRAQVDILRVHDVAEHHDTRCFMAFFHAHQMKVEGACGYFN
jgi:dihydropteroate synthase